MNRIPKYSSGAGDVGKMTRSGMSMGAASSTASSELKSLASTTSEVASIHLTRKKTDTTSSSSSSSSTGLSGRTTSSHTGTPMVTFEEEGPANKIFIGIQGIGGTGLAAEEIGLGVDEGYMENAVDVYDELVEMMRSNPTQCPKFPAADEYFWYSPEDKQYWYVDTDGRTQTGSFAVWKDKAEGERIFKLLTGLLPGARQGGISAGVSSVDYELGHHSLGMSKPHMKSRIVTSLNPNKEPKELETELKTKTRKALVDGKAVDGKKYDNNLKAILHNHQLLKKATQAQMKAIDADTSLSDMDKMVRKMPLQRLLNELDQMDLFAVVAAASIKGKAKKDQVSSARKLAQTIYEQHIKNQSWTDEKINNYRPNLFGGARHSTNRDVFVYASQIAAMAIDDPMERQKFLKDQVEGGSGKTLLSVIEDDQGFFVMPGSRGPNAREELQEYLKDSDGSIDHPESLAERILLEQDGPELQDRLHQLLVDDGGADEADFNAIMGALEDGITGSKDPKDDMDEWRLPPLAT